MKYGFLALLLLGSFTAFGEDVVNMTCTENGNEAGLESLALITQTNGKMRARVTLNVGGASETYSYRVRRLPPSPQPIVYRAALNRFNLAVCTTCTPTGKKNRAWQASVSFKAPKKAKFYERKTRFEYKNLACLLVK